MKNQQLELLIENLTSEGVESLTEAILKLVEIYDATLSVPQGLN